MQNAGGVDRTVGTGPSVRPWRLASGVVLFSYISMHMLNHALGLISITVAEAALDWAAGVWQSIPGTVALYGAFAVHVSLALRTIHERRNWQLPAT